MDLFFFPVEKKKHALNGAYHCPCSVFSLIFQFFRTSLLNYIILAGSQGVKMKIQCLSRIYSLFCSALFLFPFIFNSFGE